MLGRAGAYFYWVNHVPVAMGGAPVTTNVLVPLLTKNFVDTGAP